MLKQVNFDKNTGQNEWYWGKDYLKKEYGIFNNTVAYLS